ncbi:major capsid protein [Calditerrivibrio nitroreducens]|uniref:major capsid protein n=1 Tax=Calditerrivibrio nitroreducens TaxID=477976 RepID=UPI003C78C151
MDLSAVQAAISNSLTNVQTIALTVFSVLAAIWGIRKIVKMLNKSVSILIFLEVAIKQNIL